MFTLTLRSFRRSLSVNLYETVTTTILEALERGVVPWRKPWDTSAAIPVNATTNRPYRGVNLILLSMSPYRDHRWLTFKQVAERGGRVRAGERTTLVVFWKRWEPPTPDDDDRSSSRHVPLLRYYRVFNAEQCENLGLATVPERIVTSEHQRIERADALVRRMSDPPRIIEGGTAAWYHPGDDAVQVPKMERFASADAFYATLFHELGHATGHKKRLARPGVAGRVRFDSAEYSREELVAELTSAFCCATASLDNSLIEDAASYINNWLKVLKSDTRAIVFAAAQAQRAADYIQGVTHSL